MSTAADLDRLRDSGLIRSWEMTADRHYRIVTGGATLTVSEDLARVFAAERARGLPVERGDAAAPPKLRSRVRRASRR